MLKGRRITTYWLLALTLVPMAAEWARLQLFSTTRATLMFDLATADFDIRLAQYGHLLVGPPDRYGWHHPGPALYYLYAAAYWVFGASARTLYATSLLIAMACVVLSIVVIRRRTNDKVGKLAVVAIAVVIIVLLTVPRADPTTNPLSLINTPWGPYVVIMPTVLLVVLGAAAIDGAWSMVAFLAVGSFLVQTDVATAPLVGLLVIAVVATAVVRAVHRTSDGSQPSASTIGRLQVARRTLVATGVGFTIQVLLWVLPIAQQIRSPDGNLAALISFGREHALFHLSALLRVFLLWRGIIGHQPAGVFPNASVGTWLTVILVTGLITATALVAVRRSVSGFPRHLVAITALGIAASMYAGAAIIGPDFEFLLAWTEGVAFAGILAVTVVFGSATDLTPKDRLWRLAPRLGWLTSAGAIAVTAALVVQVSEIPGLATTSLPATAIVTSQILGLVHARDEPILLKVVSHGTSYNGGVVGYETYYEGAVYWGVVDELAQRGVRWTTTNHLLFNFLGNGPYGLEAELTPLPPASIVTVSIGWAPGDRVSKLPPPWPKLVTHASITPASAGASTTTPAPVYANASQIRSRTLSDPRRG